MNNPVVVPLGMACVTFLVALVYIFKATQAGPIIYRTMTVFVDHGERNYLHYLIGSCLILGACFTAFYDNFMPADPKTMAEYGWWQVLALLAKSMGAAPAALLAYLMRSPLTPKTEVTTVKTTESVAPAIPLP